MKLLAILISAALIYSCQHTPKKSKSAKKKKDNLDYSLAGEKDFESPLFTEGYKFRFSKAFELPLTDENQQTAKRVANTKP